MRKWTNTQPKCIEIAVLVFDEFSNHCLANSVEPFRATNFIAQKPLYNWQFLSLDGGAVKSSSGLEIATRKVELDTFKADYLFVVASYNYDRLANTNISRSLKQLAAKARAIAGLDTGAWLLASAGLLDGKEATIHRELLDSFAEKFLKTKVVNARYVKAGNTITCGGAMAAFDLAAALIGEHYGEAARQDMQSFFLHQLDEGPQPIIYETGVSTIKKCLQIMDDNIEEPLSIAQIAIRLDVDQKKLQRKFLKEFGATPHQVYRHKRLNFARLQILGSNLPMSEIAVRCGYENASAMTRAFKNEFGITPTSLRN